MILGSASIELLRQSGESVGAEIDLVLDLPKRGRWAIEIKRGLAPKPEKGFYVACEDIEPDRSPRTASHRRARRPSSVV